MLSIGKLAGGAEDYYLASVARGQEEYYIGAGEAPGYWLGEGAASLCLHGDVEAEVLRALLAGRLPRGSSPAKLAGDPKRRVAGFDLTFSAPKSVSLLYGLSSEDVSLSVRESHDEAVASALCYLEAHGTRARRGAGGATRIPTTGLVGAAFRHRTSRAGDPQLHTHVLCANLVQGDDGRWSAPDARLLYYQGRAAGYLYQAVLRHELARRLGVRFGPIRTGTAEIEGISPAVMRAFSTRRAAIEERLATWGLDSPSAARVAALDTRPAKQPPAHALQLDPGSATGPDSEVHAGTAPDIYVAADPANDTDTDTATDGPGALRETWQAKAAALGLHPSTLADLLGRPRSDPPGEGCRANIVAELLSPAGLTAQVSSFERRDVVCQVATRLPDGAPAKVLELLADEVMSAPEVVALGRLGPGGEERSSTIELLCTEERMVELAMSQKASGVALVDARVLGRVLDSHPSLSAEQRVMVEHLTCSGDGVEVVLGQAGTGKTFALFVAREAWEASRMRVRGAALAARAASELEEGAAIPSMTLAQLEAALGQGSVVFDKDDVLVIDEAGMVGTRTLARVIDALSRVGAKAVLIGDHRQLPEIDAGGAFGALARSLAATELSVNRRQSDPWEQTALVELRSGEVSAALAAYDEAGRVHVFDTARDAQHGLVEAWYEAFSTGSDARMYAARRVDVEALNGIARSLLRSEGRLGEDCYRTASGLGFARGEDVVCLRNDRRLGVENSTRGVLLYEGEGGLAIRITSGTRHLDAAYLEEGHLGYGYASTIHKAQGATVDRAFVYATASLYREAGYVAMSRARSGTDLYVPSASFETGIEHTGSRSDDPALEASHQGEHRVFSLAESLSVSRAKSLASDERAAPPMTTTAAHRGARAKPHPLQAPPRAPTPRTGISRVAPQGTSSPELPRHLPKVPGHLPQLPRHLPEAPAHLVEVIGYPPAFLDERDTWERAAQLIESYRRRFAITGDVALGPRPSGTLQRVAFEEALAAITAHQRRQGHERALEPPALGRLIGR